MAKRQRSGFTPRIAALLAALFVVSLLFLGIAIAARSQDAVVLQAATEAPVDEEVDVPLEEELAE